MIQEYYSKHTLNRVLYHVGTFTSVIVVIVVIITRK